VVKQLHAANIGCAAIHGNKSQAQRTMALNAFRKGEIRILVATDIAARGIDVSGVSHVFNYDMPNVPEQYVHRIGRTARAGAEGIAISLVAGEEKGWLRQIEKLTRVQLTPMSLPADFLAIKAALPKPAPMVRRFDEPAGRGGRGGERAEGDRPRRQFQPGRRSGGVGVHRNAVRKTSGRETIGSRVSAHATTSSSGRRGRDSPALSTGHWAAAEGRTYRSCQHAGHRLIRASFCRRP
jgi:ATP-dependent RNA helicase RhlE